MFARAWPGLRDVMRKENGGLKISADFHKQSQPKVIDTLSNQDANVNEDGC